VAGGDRACPLEKREPQRQAGGQLGMGSGQAGRAARIGRCDPWGGLMGSRLGGKVESGWLVA
jgi:hypothetical protein